MPRNSHEPIYTPMNEVKIAFWSEHRRLITDRLNGCTGVAIISPTAGILAHIPPRPDMSLSDPRAGTQNLNRILQDMINLYNANRRHFDHGHSFIVAGIHQNIVAVPDALHTAQVVVHRLHLPFAVKYYQVLEASQPRAAGQTSIVIEGTVGQWPRVYVNNEEFRYH